MDRRPILLPRNLTWNLKMMVSKRNLLFQGLLFRFHVKFQGCVWKIDTLQGCRQNKAGIPSGSSLCPGKGEAGEAANGRSPGVNDGKCNGNMGMKRQHTKYLEQPCWRRWPVMMMMMMMMMILLNNTPSFLLARQPLWNSINQNSPHNLTNQNAILVPPHLGTRNAMYLNTPPVPLLRCSIRCVCGHGHLGQRFFFINLRSVGAELDRFLSRGWN